MIDIKKNIKLRNVSLKSRLRIIIIVLVFLSIVTLASFWLVSDSNEDNSNEESQQSSQPAEPYVEGPGGDPNSVVTYHEQAVEAWNSGDKEKAKELANKGLEANNKLTKEQLEQVPNQNQITYEMSDIAEGIYYRGEDAPIEPEN